MNPTKDHPWHRAVVVFDAFWLVPLNKIERLCYFYLSTFCGKRPWPISLGVMSRTIGIKTERVKQAIDALIVRRMVSKTERKGHASLYLVLHMTEQGWGTCPQTYPQTALPIPPNGVTPLPPNGVRTYPQTASLTIDLERDAQASTTDQALLSMFQKHFRRWRFNRKPIGRKFHFTRPMVSRAIECMRYLNQTMHTTEAFDSFLDGCGEYLALSRDVLSEGRDQRALSPVQWLNQWPEQIRLAGIYQDEKTEKVTRITAG